MMLPPPATSNALPPPAEVVLKEVGPALGKPATAPGTTEASKAVVVVGMLTGIAGLEAKLRPTLLKLSTCFSFSSFLRSSLSSGVTSKS